MQKIHSYLHSAKRPNRATATRRLRRELGAVMPRAIIAHPRPPYNLPRNEGTHWRGPNGKPPTDLGFWQPSGAAVPLSIGSQPPFEPCIPLPGYPCRLLSTHGVAT